MLIVGLCGPEGAGKSTAAKLLIEAFGGEVVPFAGPLKRMIAALGVDPRHLYGAPADKIEPLAIFGGKSARWAMQTLGTEWGREHFGADFWCRAWASVVDGLDTGLVLADDIRFQSEVDAIRARGGIIIQIIRSGADLNRKPKHASENFAALPYDVRVLNSGTQRQLAAKLRKAIGAHTRPKPVASQSAGKARGKRKTPGVVPLPAGDVRLVTEGVVSHFAPIEAAE